MDITDLAEDYLVDRKECMKKLTATLLNEVMQQEAENQIQARPYERTGKRKAHRNGTRSRSLKTIHGEISLINLKSESSHSRPLYSRGILE